MDSFEVAQEKTPKFEEIASAFMVCCTQSYLRMQEELKQEEEKRNQGEELFNSAIKAVSRPPPKKTGRSVQVDTRPENIF